jgi:hypothetical protein
MHITREEEKALKITKELGGKSMIFHAQKVCWK